MSERPERPVLPVLLAIAVVALLAGLATAGYELGRYKILPVFAGDYVRARGEALAIAGFAAAYLAGAALYAGARSRSGARASDRPSAGRLVRISIVVVSAYAALSVLVEPRLEAEYQSIRRRSAEASDHIRLAQVAEKSGDWQAVALNAEAYLAINPTDNAWRRNADDAAAKLASAAAAARAPVEPARAPVGASRTGPQEPTAESLLAKAREYLAREDYATAYTFAVRAQALAPTSSEAGALRRQAADALARVGAGAAERAATDLYRVKEQGAAALKAGDPVRAYYIFERGCRAYPQDAEILDLRAGAERELSQFAFFRDGIPNLRDVPPRNRVRHVAFVNRRETGAAELVYADTLVRNPGSRVVTEISRDGTRNSSRRAVVDVYLFDVEIMAFGGGALAYHLSAPVGYVVAPMPAAENDAGPIQRLLRPPAPAPQARVSLLALSRSVEEDRLAPLFLSGTDRAFARFAAPASDGGTAPAGPVGSLMPLAVPVETLPALGLESGNARERNTIELWTLSQVLPDVALRVELALRAIRPFLLLALGALAAGLARRHAPVAVFSTGTWLLTPALAAVAHMMFVLALHGARIAVVVLSDRLGWQAGMVVMAVALVALLALAFVGLERALRREVA